MIVASLLLVIAAAVTLLVGLLNRDVIQWVYASIACCLLAGLLLTIGVLRSRPSRKPVLQSGSDGAAASWAGASQWGGSASNDSGSDVLTRDDDEDATTALGSDTPLTGDDEPTRTGLQTSVPETTADDESALWAPADADDEDTGDVRIVESDATVEAEPVAEPAPADDLDDVVVVPKPSARNGADAAGQTAAVADVSDAPVAVTPAASAAKSDDAARFEQVLSPIAGVGAAKRAALFQHFGTYRKLRAASPEKLAEVPGVSRALADRIYAALHSK
jgi:hypothetical protein